MSNKQIRKKIRDAQPAKAIFILLLDDEISKTEELSYTQYLTKTIEQQLNAIVEVVSSIDQAKVILTENPEKFFLAIAKLNSSSANYYEEVDLLSDFNIPVIALVESYSEEVRNQLIKRHVIDYIVKGNNFHVQYICNLIERIYKNTQINVLVIDDSMVSRFVIARELELLKFNVLQASNGLDGLLMLKQNSDIKMVLVDHQMPKIDGVSFVTRAREYYDKDKLLIIGLSTSEDTLLAVKFLKAGANDFIAKPFNYEIMLCRINQNLDMLDAVDTAKDVANFDYLSGLYNRRYFFENGGRMLASQTEEEFVSAMMIDIDFFKKINDAHGHDVGDEVIRNIASLLKMHFPNDLIARIGGEEFTVLSLGSNHVDNLLELETFRQSVMAQKIVTEHQVIHYTCSIGLCSKRSGSLDELLILADKNLYQAKRAGRNQVKAKLFS
jgi:diguanylate cyclase (GGDEF)-like protein